MKYLKKALGLGLKGIISLGLIFSLQLLTLNLYLDYTQNPTPHSPIIKIMRSVNFGPYSQGCSGVVVSPEYALTAAHCFPNPAVPVPVHLSYAIKSEDSSKVVPVILTAWDGLADIAVIKGDFRGFMVAKVEDSGVNTKKKLETCGYAVSNHLMCFPWKFKAQALANRAFRAIGDGQVYPGMSGGPLIDRSTWTVYGVNYGVNPENDGSNFFYPAVNPLVNSQVRYNYRAGKAKLIEREWVYFPVVEVVEDLISYMAELYLFIKNKI